MPEKTITRKQVYKARTEKELKALVLEHCVNTIGWLPAAPYAFVTPRTDLLIIYVLTFMPHEVIKYVATHVAFHENDDSPTSGETYIAVCLHKINDDINHNIVFDSMFRYYNNKYKCAIIAHEIGHAYHAQLLEGTGEDVANDFGEQYGFP